MTEQHSFHDVVILGSGMAGCTLARQLKLRMPDLNVVCIDRLKRPLPDAAHKVGESSVTAGGYYLEHVVQLSDYMAKRQLPKFGLRYFYPRKGVPFEQRPEFGMNRFHPTELSVAGVPEWQIDRGRFENDLREMNIEAGVELLEGWRLADFQLGTPHVITVEDMETKEARRLSTKWFVDASGILGPLKKKLKLEKKLDLPPCSSAWFRVRGKIDPSKLGSDPTWYARAEGKHPSDPEYGRYNSTTHLMGDGYWVWIIPLSTGATSIGVVVQEHVIPFRELTTLEGTMAWIKEREPELEKLLRDHEVLDFKTLRNYTYSSKQVISAERWACTGIAGCFADPFYSPGNDSIAFMNSLITDSIELDRSGGFTEAHANAISREFIDWIEVYTRTIQEAYPYFGKAVISALKIMWDMGIGQSTSHPLFLGLRFKPGYVERRLRMSTMANVIATQEKTLALNAQMRAFFQEWAKKTTNRLSFEFLELFDDNPVVNESLHETHAVPESPFQVISVGMKRVESVALTYFLIALEDVMPELLPKMLAAEALNPYGISLDPARWEADKLFDPVTPMAKSLEYRDRLRSRMHMTSDAKPAEPPVREAVT